MRRLAALLGAAALVAAGGHAEHAVAPATSVAIGFSAYTPGKVTVIAGERVRFSNDSVRDHTVSADDDSFDSGRLNPGERYDLATKATGSFAYHCSLHPGITGEVDVRTLLIAPPSTVASPGREFPLRGRTSLAPRTELTIEADGRPVATTPVAEDGSFAATITPTTTASYRVVAGNETSNAVRLVVLDRTVSLTRKRNTLTATVTPASRGAHVVLQLYLPRRFGWWPVQRARLDKHSRARFVVRTRRRLRARVLMTLPDGATTLAQSNTVRVGTAHTH